MVKQRRCQLNDRSLRKPRVSKASLLCVVLARFALTVCPLLAVSTAANNPYLCFINWHHLLVTGYCFADLGITLFRSSFQQSVIRYGLRRVAICGLFIIIASYFSVAVVLDRAALMTWDAFESNFIKRFEENIVTVNETRKEFTLRDIRTHEPMKVEQQMRYKGEDVRLVCEDTLYFNTKVKFHEKQVIWKHNFEPIVSSSRHHIKTVFEEIPKDDRMKRVAENLDIDFYVYHVKSEIDIYLIGEGDFGKYSCHVAKTAITIGSINTSPENDDGQRTKQQRSDKTDSNGRDDDGDSNTECPLTQQEENHCPCPLEVMRLLLQLEQALSYSWEAEIFLKEIKPNKKTISVPVGSIVSTSASYTHLEDRRIDFDHKINGKSFVDTYSGRDQSCSILIYLYWFLLHDGGHYASIPAFNSQQIQMDEGIGGRSWQCASAYTYGLHTFVFYREFYNTTLQRYQTVSIDYPDSVEIVPERPNILDAPFNGTNDAFLLPETACWGSFKTTVCIYLEEILQNMATNLFFREKVVLLVMSPFFITALLVVMLILRQIIKPGINEILGRNRHVSVSAVESSRTLAGLANSNNTLLKYDLYISCAPEQKELAADIADYLKSHGLRVCHCDADILGHEIKTQGLSRLITESWKFLVIVTPDYVNSGRQNDFEMQLILQRLHDGYTNESNIALMSSESNLIPAIFNHFKQFNWSDGGNIDVLNNIKYWIGPSIFPSSSLTTVQIVSESHFQFTSPYTLFFSCFCFCTLFLVLLKGTI